MAKALALKAEIREKAGTSAARSYRRKQLLPAVVYGHQQENLSVAVSEHDFVNAIHHGTHLFELQLPDNKAETVLLKQVQYDHLGTNPLHVDFTRVNLSERVSVAVPLTLRGTPAGVEEGGILQQVQMELQVQCVVTEIPEEIRVRINDLNIGDSVYASDIELPEGVTLDQEETDVIVSITTPIEEEEVAEEAEAAEVGAEPEVIGKGKEEEEEEAEGEEGPSEE